MCVFFGTIKNIKVQICTVSKLKKIIQNLLYIAVGKIVSHF